MTKVEDACVSKGARFLVVLLPAYNERVALERMVPRVLSAIRGRANRVAVYIIDDGSSDSTADFARDAEVEIRVVSHRQNLGYGCALSTGFTCALDDMADVVVTMDADDTHEPSCIPAMLDALETADVAVASRYISGAQVRGVPILRSAISAIANRSATGVLGIRSPSDLSSGFRAYRASALRSIQAVDRDFAQVSRLGFVANVWLVLELIAVGYRVAEIPIRLEYGRKPSPSSLRLLSVLYLGGRVLLKHVMVRASVALSNSVRTGRGGSGVV